jgi:micrococcal nuclease
MKMILTMALLSAAPLLEVDTIPAAQAKDHIGETGTVCGRVADARYQETGSHVTFLNFDKAYPNHTFTAFIPAQNRGKFDAPEKKLKDKDVCVTGKIEEYRGKPEIIVTEPAQLRAQGQ